ncbi:MAG: chain length determinant protein EpsF, partial [Pseudomonadota bacterium]
MTFSQFLAIVRARWVLIASIFVATISVTLVVSLLLPKKYSAMATVMVDARPDPVSGMGMNGIQQSTILATQVDI